MDCPTAPLSSAAFLTAFHRRAFDNRVPLNCSLDLTQRCNLACVHCYCGDRATGAPPVTGRPELSAAELGDLFDQLADAGCFSILLTGGDPLLRQDFETIYARAKSCGFLLNVFTNGTLIRRTVIDVLRDLPPRAVEITLYGASEETYRRVTGARGAYERCRQGIEALLAAGIRVRLKTVLMSLNVDDFTAMKGIAAGYGVPFRFDAAISGRVGGDRTPISLRVPAATVVDLEMSDPKLAKSWLEWASTERDGGDATRLFNCGAGRTSFHVDFDGTMRVCTGSRLTGYDLRRVRFDEAWERLGVEISTLAAPEGMVCNSCRLKTFCSWCPVFSELEGTNGIASSPYLCRLAQERAAWTGIQSTMEGQHEKGDEHHTENLQHAASAQA